MLSCSPLLYLSLFTLGCRLPDDDEAVALFLRGHHQSMQKMVSRVFAFAATWMQLSCKYRSNKIAYFLSLLDQVAA